MPGVRRKEHHVLLHVSLFNTLLRDHHGHVCMLVGFTTSCAIGAYHH